MEITEDVSSIVGADDIDLVVEVAGGVTDAKVRAPSQNCYYSPLYASSTRHHHHHEHPHHLIGLYLGPLVCPTHSTSHASQQEHQFSACSSVLTYNAARVLGNTGPK